MCRNHLPKKIMEEWMASCGYVHIWSPCCDRLVQAWLQIETQSQPSIQQKSLKERKRVFTANKTIYYSGNSGKVPGGWDFYLWFWVRLAQIKVPPRNFHFFGSFFRFWNMDPKSQTTMARPSKRPKLQQSITSMLQGIGPKFVEATGKQLVCPYCQYKFRAPQGTNSWGLDKVL